MDFPIIETKKVKHKRVPTLVKYHTIMKGWPGLTHGYFVFR